MKYLLLIYSNPANWEHPLFLCDPRFLAMPVEERDEPARQADRAGRQSGQASRSAGVRLITYTLSSGFAAVAGSSDHPSDLGGASGDRL
ncbi:hypothetical protein [Nonomuraea sp. CA-141351]|uniref:hypothetical protein n=1 Tax=Nonomuraea sp. CA-141351 TaxID=3239996 RepID=UPI003D94005D